MLSNENGKSVEGKSSRHFMHHPLAVFQGQIRRETGVVERTIHLTLTSKEEDICNATEQGSEFLRSQGLATDAIRTQALLLQELIRTGIEYGSMCSSQYLITVFIHVKANSILTEVRYPIDARNRSRLTALDRTVQFIRGHQDPLEAYQRMKRADNISTPHAALGLARITCEAGAFLDFFLEEDDILNLTVVRSLNSVLGESNRT